MDDGVTQLQSGQGRCFAGVHGSTPYHRLATSAVNVALAKAAQAGFPRRGGRARASADAPAARARPSEHAAAPARPASADAIKEMMLALECGHQALSGVPGGGSTDDAAGSGSEGQQGSGTHLAGQVAVAGDGALVNIGKAHDRAKKGTGSSASVQDIARRVREWGIQKPPRAKHSAWRWAFKYKTPPRQPGRV